MNFKKLMSLMLAFIMMLAVVAPTAQVFASAGTAEAEKTTQVTLHKLLMKDLTNWNSKEISKKYDGTQDFNALLNLEGADKTATQISGVYFAWQMKDAQGNWKYIKEDGEIITKDPTSITKEAFESAGVFGDVTMGDGKAFNTSKLPQTKPTEYRIVEVKELSTYKNTDGSILADSKAVPVEITLPFVNNDGVQKEVHVYPKNTENKPQIDKNFTKENNLTAAEFSESVEKNQNLLNSGADYANSGNPKAIAKAEIGKKIPYEVKTKFPKGTEYKNGTWTDTMSNGLTFNQDVITSGKKLTATYEDGSIEFTANDDYVLTQDDRGFTLKLTEKGLKKISEQTKPVDDKGQSTGKGKDVEITLTYSSTVNSNAIIDVPESNSIKFEYGNKPKKNIEKKPVTPQDGKLTVIKTWSEGNAPEGVNVVYTLTSDSGKSYSVALNNKTGQKTIDLGDGVQFKVTDAQKLSGQFTGLKSELGATWNITERVSGYDPVYGDTSLGSVNITNKKDTENPTPLNPTEPKVVVGGKKFVKTDQDGKPLPNAKFVVKKDNNYLHINQSEATNKANILKFVEADKAYKAQVALLKVTPDGKIDYSDMSVEPREAATILKLKNERDAAFKAATLNYTWSDKDGATEFVSNDKGQIEVVGLEYGEYELEEIAPPTGYAKLTKNVEFKVGTSDDKLNINYEDASTNLPNALQIVNKKVTIPQTGGIGTIIFTVAGLAIMGGAFYAMKKRNEEQEEA